MESLDWAVLGIYFLAVLALGLGAGSKIKTFFEYFLAGRSLPIWAVGISAIAAETSAATFVGAPDTAFRGNFNYLQTTFGAVLSRFVIAFFIIETYYRLNVVTVYEVLERRFGRGAQLLSSVLFCCGRLLASAARVYIAALAVSGISGLSVSAAICALGGAALVYGVFGGLRSVIWVEVLQGVVFLVGGLAAAVFLVWQLGPSATWLPALETAGKLQIFNFNFAPQNAAFWADPYSLWGALLGGLILGLATHSSDQDMVQRLLACRTSGEGRRSVVLAGLLEFPVAFLFVSLGALLWAFYQQNALSLPPGTTAFPDFISHYMPAGLRGLLLAAILAAAMSSLDSSITALSSVTARDVLRLPETLRFARVLSLGWGLALVCVALLLADWHQAVLAGATVSDPARRAELLTFALGIMALIYGPLLSMFLLALFSRRGSPGSILLGTLIGCGFAAYLQFFCPLAVGWTWQIVFSAALSLLVMATGKCRAFDETKAALR